MTLELTLVPYSLGAESRKKSYAKHFGYKLATGLHLKKFSPEQYLGGCQLEIVDLYGTLCNRI